jgi:hypothetical protein
LFPFRQTHAILVKLKGHMHWLTYLTSFSVIRPGCCYCWWWCHVQACYWSYRTFFWIDWTLILLCCSSVLFTFNFSADCFSSWLLFIYQGVQAFCWYFILLLSHLVCYFCCHFSFCCCPALCFLWCDMYTCFFFVTILCIVTKNIVWSLISWLYDICIYNLLLMHEARFLNL